MGFPPTSSATACWLRANRPRKLQRGEEQRASFTDQEHVVGMNVRNLLLAKRNKLAAWPQLGLERRLDQIMTPCIRCCRDTDPKDRRLRMLSEVGEMRRSPQSECRKSAASRASNWLSIINLSGCHWPQKSPKSFQNDLAAASLGHLRPDTNFKPSCYRGGPRSGKRRCAPRVRADSAAPKKTTASNLERSCARTSIDTLRQTNESN